MLIYTSETQGTVCHVTDFGDLRIHTFPLGSPVFSSESTELTICTLQRASGRTAEKRAKDPMLCAKVRSEEDLAFGTQEAQGLMPSSPPRSHRVPVASRVSLPNCGSQLSDICS